MRSSVLTFESREDDTVTWATMHEHEGVKGPTAFTFSQEASEAVHARIASNLVGIHFLSGIMEESFCPDRDIEENDIREDRKHE